MVCAFFRGFKTAHRHVESLFDASLFEENFATGVFPHDGHSTVVREHTRRVCESSAMMAASSIDSHI